METSFVKHLLTLFKRSGYKEMKSTSRKMKMRSRLTSRLDHIAHYDFRDSQASPKLNMYSFLHVLKHVMKWCQEAVRNRAALCSVWWRRGIDKSSKRTTRWILYKIVRKNRKGHERCKWDHRLYPLLDEVYSSKWKHMPWLVTVF